MSPSKIHMLKSSPSSFATPTGRSRKLLRAEIEETSEENDENAVAEEEIELEKYSYESIKEERQAASREKERSMCIFFVAASHS